MSGFEVIFGVVAGGAGFVSLGLQLGDCAKRLKKIYSDCKDAPRFLSRLSFEIEIVAMALQMLENHRQLNHDQASTKDRSNAGTAHFRLPASDRRYATNR